MSQPAASFNTKLIDSLAQIVLSLTDEEQLLEQRIQHLQFSEEELQLKREALRHEIAQGYGKPVSINSHLCQVLLIAHLV